jgi:hypothetical protein
MSEELTVTNQLSDELLTQLLSKSYSVYNVIAVNTTLFKTAECHGKIQIITIIYHNSSAAREPFLIP